MAVQLTGLFLFLCVAFYTDVTRRKIPNLLNGCGFLAGIGVQVAVDGWNGAVFALIGAGAGFLAALLLYLCKALSAGDVKLFAAIGVWTGPEKVLAILIVSIAYSAIIGIAVMIYRGEWSQRSLKVFRTLMITAGSRDMHSVRTLANDPANWRFPFMVAVFPAVVTVSFLFP